MVITHVLVIVAESYLRDIYRVCLYIVNQRVVMFYGIHKWSHQFRVIHDILY